MHSSSHAPAAGMSRAGGGAQVAPASEAPQRPLLRGLEGDLRALCADSKRRGPAVKEAAERVILLLREAESPESRAAAANEAAAVLCAFCHPPDHAEGAAAVAAQTRVAVRAVACLHRLLTHRAAPVARLSELIDAFERLGIGSTDDAITLKVLQALLSLLTVADYLHFLPATELARAFSLLFKLRSVRGPASTTAAAAVVAAAGPLAAIASSSTSKQDADEGVIELTAKAAFRQVASDLFACAAEALRAGDGASGARLDVLPSMSRWDSTSENNAAPSQGTDNGVPDVVQAAYGLFQDLCALLVGDKMQWFMLDASSEKHRIDTVLALEVMDDGLSGTVSLFLTPHIDFSNVLAARLCPAIHRLLRVANDRAVLKALFGLIVTLVRGFWNRLIPDMEVILSSVTKVLEFPDAATPSWAAYYAMDALRSLMRRANLQGSSRDHCDAIDWKDDVLLSMFKSFEIDRQGGHELISDLIRGACVSALRCATALASGSSNSSGHPEDHGVHLSRLPMEPLRCSSRPYPLPLKELAIHYVGSGAGTCLGFCASARLASERGQTRLAKVLLSEPTVTIVVSFLDRLLLEAPAAQSALEGSESVLGLLVTGLVDLAIAGDRANVPEARIAAVAALAKVCRMTVSTLGETTGEGSVGVESRVIVLYRALFSVARECGEHFGPSWQDLVRATQPLDMALYGDTTYASVADTDITSSASLASFNLPSLSPLLVTLRMELDASFASASSLSWVACSELVSALIVSSRASLVSLSNRSLGDSIVSTSMPTITKASSEMRIFGIARAESVICTVFAHASAKIGPMPQGLWQLLAGHLVAVACDSTVLDMRIAAIKALVRIASSALEAETSGFVSQDKVMSPISDLLSSSFTSTREGCLDCIYTILETRGEFIKGSGTWAVILGILRSASGMSLSDSTSDGNAMQRSGERRREGSNGMASQLGEDLRSASRSGTFSDRQETAEKQQLQRQSAPQAEDAMIQRGFRAVQLIADDFLSFLASETLSDWVEVLGRYGRQSEDVNVALTSVGLLWRTADYVAKICSSGGYDSLWMDLFEVLKAIGSDERPEVRNGAVKTLTSTLKAHGGQLSALAWRGCIERALLPLLEEVMKGGDVDSGKTALATRTRADSQLVLHYSRDTPRKQWNETRVLALGGVAGVLRLAMPRLALLLDDKNQPLLLLLADGGSEGLWAKMLRAAVVAASSSETEVSLAGVRALLELLNASGSIAPQVTQVKLKPSVSAPEAHSATKDRYSIQGSRSWMSGILGTSVISQDEPGMMRSGGVSAVVDGSQTDSAHTGDVAGGFSRKGPLALWEAVWAALGDAVSGTQAGGHGKITNTKSLAVLADGLGRAREELADRFSHKSSVDLLAILGSLLVGDGSSTVDTGSHGKVMEPDAVPGDRPKITEVQSRAIAVIESLSFGDDVETWMAMIDMLMQIVDRRRSMYVDVIISRLMHILEMLYEGDGVPREVKLSKLRSTMECLGPVMMRHHAMVAESAVSHSPRLGYNRHVVHDVMIPSTSSSLEPNEVLGGESAPPGAAGAGAKSSEQDDRRNHMLWVVAVEAFVKIVGHGLEVGNTESNVWPVLRRVVFDFLYSSRRDFYDSFVQPRSLAETAALDKYDILMSTCVRDALGRMGDNLADDIQTSMVDLLTRGAREGMRGRRARFVRSCQSSLFSLADARARSDVSRRGVPTGVADRASKCIVEVSDEVLRRYVEDGRRAGKCPLPAARRAEAVFILKRLGTLRLRTDRDDARGHLRTLHVRLCECVDVEDEAIRTLAHAVLDDFAPAREESLVGGI